MVYVVMGVSGSGKTLIGRKLADYLDCPFYDGDDFHPETNIKKMEAGHALNDDDRRPWLKILAENIHNWNEKGGAVLACSALKKSYRDLLRDGHANKEVQFIFLQGSFSLIAERLAGRSNHFMPEKLLASQFKALEEPKKALSVSIDQPPNKIVEKIAKQLKNAS